MAVVFEQNNSHARLVVYKIEEDNTYYERGIDFTESDRAELDKILHPVKIKQWLASRYWIKKMSGENRTLYLKKSELGKPEIINSPFYFSISHSKEYVAVICSDSHDVAIDIEMIDDKLSRVKHKFLHPNDYEQGDSLENLALIWSAKEVIYKYFHTRELYSFGENIAITSRDLNTLSAEVMLNGHIKSLTLNYHIDSGMVCVYLN